MNRQKIFAAILSGSLVLSLAGCGNHIEPANSGAPSQTVPADVTSDTTISDDIAYETSSENEPSSLKQAAEESKPQKEEKTEENSNVPTEAVTPKPSKPPKTESSSPASQSQPEKPQTPSSSEQKPAESKPPVEPSSPEAEESSEPSKPAFSINDWITFAKSYAGKVGLMLNPEAVECWDNPIPANENCTTLEQSIKSRLNLYARNGDITDVWIWAEEITPNSYEIYIGYA